MVGFTTSSKHVYPQFIVDERTGGVKINLIEEASGRVVRRIPSSELNMIVQDYCSIYGITPQNQPTYEMGETR
jgi:uncharacterized FlaG/YvyC family protein